MQQPAERHVILKVNGAERIIKGSGTERLLDVLRYQFGLTGAKPGCLNGDCGACTVLIDGIPIKSCIMYAFQADGKDIKTVEGLEGTDVQKAFVEHNAFQCGYCTPGFIMNTEGLLSAHPDAEEAVIEQFLQSNICRCTSYQEIKAAVHQAMANRHNSEGHDDA
ncbi:MAG: (2Fe-2S)-binding protein [Tuberibacillus sp.]